MLLRLLFFFLLVANCISSNATEIRIAVSDILVEHISETIQRLASSRSTEVSVLGIGSFPAMESLRSSEISLAIIATPDGQKLPDGGFETFVFAYSTSIVAVSEANPINEISFSDLRRIFGSASNSIDHTWSVLGINSLANRPIKPLISQDGDVGISIELFRHTVLEGKAMKLKVSEIADFEIEEMLVNNAASIAVLSRLPNNDKIKYLMVSKDSESPAFGPTNESIFYGDYPIRLPFHIVYKKDTEAELEEILRILLSDDVTEDLRAAHFFVPPDVVRTSFVKSLDLVD